MDIEQNLLDHLESKGWILSSYEDGAVAFSHGARITYTIKQEGRSRRHAMVIKGVVQELFGISNEWVILDLLRYVLTPDFAGFKLVSEPLSRAIDAIESGQVATLLKEIAGVQLAMAAIRDALSAEKDGEQ
jgi:hypothetical protein